MRIGQIGFHSCIRQHKVGWEQCRIGWEVHLVGHMVAQTHSWNTYSSVHLYNPINGETIDTRQLGNIVRMLRPYVDLFHVHNEPNWIFDVVKSNTDVPVVFDIHDWTSLRRVSEPPAVELEAEKIAIAKADGFGVPSEGYYERLKKITEKPIVCYQSRVGSWLFPEIPKEKIGGFVYAGGLSDENDQDMNYAYRDWSGFAKELAEEKDVYLYSANPIRSDRYKHDRVHAAGPFSYPELLANMARHSVGIVGSPMVLQDFEDSMPNKLFEYIASGLPVVVLNAPEAKRFVEKHKLGYGVTNAKEAIEAATELENDGTLADRRWDYAMEAEIPKITGLYRKVLGQCTKKDIAPPQHQANPEDQAGQKEAT